MMRSGLAGMTRFVLFAISMTLLPGVCAQETGVAPRFDVAIIRLSTACTGGGSEKLSPGRFGLRCVSLRQVIRVAWGDVDRFPEARPPDVFGGPGWLDTDRYDIEATALGNPGLDRMYGPMTRLLLEERFHLKLHDEVRELPVFNLTVLKNSAGVKMTRDVSCVPVDLRTVLQSPPPPNYCGRNTTTNGRTTIFNGYGVTIPEFIERGLKSLDRPVIDRTRLAGRFDIRLEFLPADALNSTDNSRPSVFTAVQEQLGLRLSAATGPVQVHVIDHIDRPSPN
jgi:uncharacterized protein (TIGR03435 family)